MAEEDKPQPVISNTLDQQLFDWTNSLLGTLLPAELMPLAQLYVKMGMPAIKKLMHVPGTDTVWSSVFASDQTTVGIANQQYNRALGGLRQEVMMSSMNQAMTNNITAFMRMLYPDEPADALQDRVNAFTSSPTKSVLYTMFNAMTGFDNGPELGQAMGVVAGNVAKIQEARGARYPLARAKDFAAGLFKDEGLYRRSDYGGMGQTERAMLTAFLTKDLDVFGGVFDFGSTDTAGAATVENAISRTTDTVKAYAKALSPLKDLFGKDIASLVQTLQSISGQSITNIGTDRLSYLTTSITGAVSHNITSLNNIIGLSAELRKDVASREAQGAVAGGYSSLGVERLAVMTETLYNGMRVQGDWMTDEAWRGLARQTAVDVATSSGADALAKAYAIWANEMATDEDRSFSAFIARASEYGEGLNGALALVGDPAGIMLDRGMAYSEYRRAKTSGEADIYNIGFAAEDTKNQLVLALDNTLPYRQALGRTRGVDSVGIAEASEVTTAYLDLVLANPAVANMDKDQLTKYLTDIKDNTNLARVDQLDMAGNFIRATYGGALANITQASQARQHNALVQNEAALRIATETWLDNIYESSHPIAQMLQRATDNGTAGFDWHKIFTGIPTIEGFVAMGQPEEDIKATFDAATVVGVKAADASFRAGHVAEAQVWGHDRIRSMAAYGMSYAALQNSSYLEARDKFTAARKAYDEALKSEDQNVIADAENKMIDTAYMMWIYQSMNPETVKRFFDNPLRIREAVLDENNNLTYTVKEITDNDEKQKWLLSQVQYGDGTQYGSVGRVFFDAALNTEILNSPEDIQLYDEYLEWLNDQNKNRPVESQLAAEQGIGEWIAQAPAKSPERAKRNRLAAKINRARSGTLDMRLQFDDTLDLQSNTFNEVLDKLVPDYTPLQEFGETGSSDTSGVNPEAQQEQRPSDTSGVNPEPQPEQRPSDTNIDVDDTTPETTTSTSTKSTRAFADASTETLNKLDATLRVLNTTLEELKDKIKMTA